MCLFGLSPHEQYSRAAIIHDYLYCSQGCIRAQADPTDVHYFEGKQGGMAW
jgi:hypothetical protein